MPTPKIATPERATDNITDVVDQIMKYEEGEMNGQEVIDFFAHLIKSGMIKNLQGSYHRAAANLIEQNLLEKDGKIIKAD